MIQQGNSGPAGHVCPMDPCKRGMSWRLAVCRIVVDVNLILVAGSGRVLAFVEFLDSGLSHGLLRLCCSTFSALEVIEAFECLR